MVLQTLKAIAATAVCALVAMAMEYIAVPHVARIIPGVLMVFFLPGFATVRAVLPAGDISTGERLLASLGVSIVITVSASVLLGATVGLSQRSAAITLSGLTLSACFFALLRERRDWRSLEDLDE